MKTVQLEWVPVPFPSSFDTSKTGKYRALRLMSLENDILDFGQAIVYESFGPEKETRVTLNLDKAIWGITRSYFTESTCEVDDYIRNLLRSKIGLFFLDNEYLDSILSRPSALLEYAYLHA